MGLLLPIVTFAVYGYLSYKTGIVVGKKKRQSELKQQGLLPSKELVNSLLVNSDLPSDELQDELIALHHEINK